MGFSFSKQQQYRDDESHLQLHSTFIDAPYKPLARLGLQVDSPRKPLFARHAIPRGSSLLQALPGEREDDGCSSLTVVLLYIYIYKCTFVVIYVIQRQVRTRSVNVA